MVDSRSIKAPDRCTVSEGADGHAIRRRNSSTEVSAISMHGWRKEVSGCRRCKEYFISSNAHISRSDDISWPESVSVDISTAAVESLAHIMPVRPFWISTDATVSGFSGSPQCMLLSGKGIPLSCKVSLIPARRTFTEAAESGRYKKWISLQFLSIRWRAMMHPALKLSRHTMS